MASKMTLSQHTMQSKQGMAMDANTGSKKITRKTMEMKSNHKGVPEHSTKYSGKPVEIGKHMVMKGEMPKHK